MTSYTANVFKGSLISSMRSWHLRRVVGCYSICASHPSIETPISLQKTSRPPDGYTDLLQSFEECYFERENGVQGRILDCMCHIMFESNDCRPRHLGTRAWPKILWRSCRASPVCSSSKYYEHLWTVGLQLLHVKWYINIRTYTWYHDLHRIHRYKVLCFFYVSHMHSKRFSLGVWR